jgi:hypothetical protein
MVNAAALGGKTAAHANAAWQLVVGLLGVAMRRRDFIKVIAGSAAA